MASEFTIQFLLFNEGPINVELTSYDTSSRHMTLLTCNRLSKYKGAFCLTMHQKQSQIVNTFQKSWGSIPLDQPSLRCAWYKVTPLPTNIAVPPPSPLPTLVTFSVCSSGPLYYADTTTISSKFIVSWAWPVYTYIFRHERRERELYAHAYVYVCIPQETNPAPSPKAINPATVRYQFSFFFLDSRNRRLSESREYCSILRGSSTGTTF